MTVGVAGRALRRYRDSLDDDKEVNFDEKQTLNIRKFLERSARITGLFIADFAVLSHDA